ncbi:MAG: nitroreductase family protein [Candidatus Woesearchaeota archaeon]|nr:MAG: nitroreductase family protein [Candidatus Woesearchaeota archaeon]
MDTLACLNTRYSVRKYSTKPVDFDMLVEIVHAGTRAPSAGNTQDFRFIIVTNKTVIEELAYHCMEQIWIASAPVVIVAIAATDLAEQRYGLRGKRLYVTQSTAAATQNMMLAAHALGLGSCWIGAFEEQFIADKFGIPPGYRPQALLTVGYPDKLQEPRVEKKRLHELLYFNRFGMPFKHPELYFNEYAEFVRKQAKNEVFIPLKALASRVKTYLSNKKKGQESQEEETKKK